MKQILLWLNGGPGCSSLYGLMTQWGPKVFTSKAPPGFEANPANLNEKFNLLFLDQPIKTGYSFSPNAADSVVTNTDAAEDVFEFLLAFKRYNFDDKRNFRSNVLHIAGESFAGHTIPFVAERISRASPALRDILQLQSIVIGNGYIDQLTHYRKLYEFVCEKVESFHACGKVTSSAPEWIR